MTEKEFLERINGRPWCADLPPNLTALITATAIEAGAKFDSAMVELPRLLWKPTAGVGCVVYGELDGHKANEVIRRCKAVEEIYADVLPQVESMIEGDSTAGYHNLPAYLRAILEGTE